MRGPRGRRAARRRRSLLTALSLVVLIGVPVIAGTIGSAFALAWGRQDGTVTNTGAAVIEHCERRWNTFWLAHHCRARVRWADRPESPTTTAIITGTVPSGEAAVVELSYACGGGRTGVQHTCERSLLEADLDRPTLGWVVFAFVGAGIIGGGALFFRIQRATDRLKYPWLVPGRAPQRQTRSESG